jgi:hypothetical protein
MNAIDEYDIREAFEALDDDDCRGKLTFVQLQTLYLGLGFTDPKSRMAVEDLQEDARKIGLNDQSLTLDQTLQLFRKVSAIELSQVSCLTICYDDSKRSFYRSLTLPLPASIYDMEFPEQILLI